MYPIRVLVKFFIIFLASWPRAYSQDIKNLTIEKSSQSLEHLLKESKDSPYSSNVLANLALKELDENKLGPARAHIERSLFLNPLNIQAYKIKAAIIEKVFKKDAGATYQNGLPSYFYFLDFIPYILSLFLAALSFLFFAFILAKTKKTESLIYMKSPQWRLRSLLAFLLFSAFITLFIAKNTSSQTTWVCLLEDSVLYTGPQKSFNVSARLPLGACTKVLEQTKEWLSLAPYSKNPGWIPRSQTEIVRGKGFDALTD